MLLSPVFRSHRLEEEIIDKAAEVRLRCLSNWLALIFRSHRQRGSLMSETCTFCRIAAADLPAYKLFEDELVLAFLDLHPIREGHALIIPKQHYPWFEDMPEQVTARRCCHVN
ncbi:HIT family protein [Marivivens aquimaris]|jgi:hypothetical protein|uniref:HIT family protein n=2 Tax=Rhodobacterales TaxID=204455 RepID=UPI001D160A89|nr:HIT domain-containing protein [Marivivens aquimaris]